MVTKLPEIKSVGKIGNRNPRKKENKPRKLHVSERDNRDFKQSQQYRVMSCEYD